MRAFEACSPPLAMLVEIALIQRNRFNALIRTSVAGKKEMVLNRPPFD
jgi:hypothetical protein